MPTPRNNNNTQGKQPIQSLQKANTKFSPSSPQSPRQQQQQQQQQTESNKKNMNNNNKNSSSSPSSFLPPIHSPKTVSSSPKQNNNNNNNNQTSFSSPTATSAAAAAAGGGGGGGTSTSSNLSLDSQRHHHNNNNNKPQNQQQQQEGEEEYEQEAPAAVPAESRIPEIKSLIAKEEHRRAIEALDDAIGSPTFSDLPMFDEQFPEPTPQYSNKTLLELLALRTSCWISLHLYGRALEDISSAMRVDLQATLAQREFVVPKLQALYELGDIQVGLQIAANLEFAVQRNGALLDEVIEWKRKFVLLARKKHEVTAQLNADHQISSASSSSSSSHMGSGMSSSIVIGSRRIATDFPGCRHGASEKESVIFFTMEVVLAQQQISDGFLALYRLYTEYEGHKLPWAKFAKQELRKAIDACALENWKQARDHVRHYLISVEYNRKREEAEKFVDSQDTLGRIPNPLHWETVRYFYKQYDRSQSSVDQLVELLAEVSKHCCSCMSEIAELRKMRVKSSTVNSSSSSSSSTSSSSARNKTKTGGEHETAANTFHSPNVTLSNMKERESIRLAKNLKEEGNVLFLARKFRSALQKFEEATVIDPSDVEIFFNKTAALFELEQFDAVVVACDRALAQSANHKSDKTLLSKLLARRADALVKLCALEEAVTNYKESLDAVENAKVRSKLIECDIEIKKRKVERLVAASGASSSTTASATAAAAASAAAGGSEGEEQKEGDGDEKNNHNDNQEEKEDEEQDQEKIEQRIIKSIGTAVPPPPFASCVLVEPVSSLQATKSSHVSLTVFPTQIQTASAYFTEAIPMPFPHLAGFPFAVVPCSKVIAPVTSASAISAVGSVVSSSAMLEGNNNNNNNNNAGTTGGGSSSGSGGENYFAQLATKPLSVDDIAKGDSQHVHHGHMKNELWGSCGSVIVLRKDFKPVSCTQVLRLFKMLLEIWTLASSSSSSSSCDSSSATTSEYGKTFESEVRNKKKLRAELFSDPQVARQKLIRDLVGEEENEEEQEGEHAKDKEEEEQENKSEHQKENAEGEEEQEGKDNNNKKNEANNNKAASSLEDGVVSDEELLANSGCHVMNTFSQRKKHSQLEKDQLVKQAMLLKDQGNVLFSARRFHSALRFYDQALNLDPNNTLAAYNKAACLIELKEYEPALECCDRALETAQVFIFPSSSLSSSSSSSNASATTSSATTTSNGGGEEQHQQQQRAALQEKIIARRNLILKKLGKFEGMSLNAQMEKSSAIATGTAAASS